MMPVDEAVALLTRDVPCKPARTLPLLEAHLRVLAAPLRSPVAVPPHDNSAMDGFAVRSADLGAPPTTLRVVASTFAGDPPADGVGPGEAVRIMTGAPMPRAGADAVIRVEDTRPAAPQAERERVEVLCGAQPGSFVRRAGEDIQRGDVVLEAGTTLTAARLGVLASIGMAELPVVQRPRVAVLTTGDELVRPGEPLGPGQIYSSNTYALLALVREAGGFPIDAGIVADDLDTTRQALREASSADILVTTGGVSMGEKDWVRVALEAEGAHLDFWKVAVKPGKPAAFGRLGKARLFCQAGNPLSSTEGFHHVVRPVIPKMKGDQRPHLPVIEVVVGEAIHKRPGRAWLERVQLSRDAAGTWLAHRTGSQSSGVLSSMSRAHGLLLLSQSSTGLTEGDRARVMVLDWSFLDGPRPSYGW